MSFPNHRLIDEIAIVSPRPQEMQVLAFGFCRTGTMSMHRALQTLGYKSYHMVEVLRNPKALNYWLEALEAKYSDVGKPYQRVEFDKLLGDYSAVTDTPCIMFVDELLAAYPDAKVILSEREIESWMASMEKTLYAILNWTSFEYIAPFDSGLVGPYWRTLKFMMKVWNGGELFNRHQFRRTYEDHYKHVRAVVPPDGLLEFQPQEGWEPLCRFLGKPIPENKPYPYINEAGKLIKAHKRMWRLAMRQTIWKVGGLVLAAGVLVMAIWYHG